MTRFPDDIYDTLTMFFGGCPSCQASMVDPKYVSDSSGVVYRTSRRSVTMRCRDCGLLWTMTAHQMAKVARRLCERDCYDARDRAALKAIDLWARNVHDTRGRTVAPTVARTPSAQPQS